MLKVLRFNCILYNAIIILLIVCLMRGITETKYSNFLKLLQATDTFNNSEKNFIDIKKQPYTSRLTVKNEQISRPQEVWNASQLRMELSIPPLVTEMQYTIVLLLYEKFKNAQQTLRNFGNNRNVSQIIVIWNNLLIPISDTFRQIALSATARIVFVQATSNSLSNRFLPRDIINTQGNIIMELNCDFCKQALIYNIKIGCLHESIIMLVLLPVMYLTHNKNII